MIRLDHDVWERFRCRDLEKPLFLTFGSTVMFGAFAGRLMRNTDGLRPYKQFS